MRRLRLSILLLLLLASAGRAAGADSALTVTRGPGAGQVRLGWTASGSVYGVFRSTDPANVALGRIGQTTVRDWLDTPAAAPIQFYLVSSPACVTGADCGSGFCVDGACCDTGCDGTCQACNVAGHVGTCSRLPDDADPSNECAVTCATLPPLPGGGCEVSAGTSGRTLLVGNVLGAADVFIGGEVLLDAAGMIACVGCGCAATDPSATVIRCPAGVISPGLIDTLDFISYAQNFPHTDTGERYEHRHEWRLGKNGHTKITAVGGATTNQQRYGELRQLMGGATSIAGTGGSTGLLRDLHNETQEEGLGQQAVLVDTFPLGDSNGLMLDSGCGYPSIRRQTDIAGRDAYHATVAEGISLAARNEFLCLSSSANGGQDLTQPQSSFRHAVGLTAADVASMAADGTGLIWSPRSNLSLYGDTARVTTAARAGATIALATDWIVSGSMNLLRELHCASDVDATYLDHAFQDSDLWRMVTKNAAELTATDDVIGTLAVGKFGDVTILDGTLAPKYHALVAARPQDVLLVMRAGKALYGAASTIEALRGPCDPIDVCGAAKEVCLVDEIGMSLPALLASVGNVYPLFACDVPPNEPTCRPYRAVPVAGSTVYDGVPRDDDPDGDGITVGDNCPFVFNPIRPMDGGVQPDADGDGLGDACDPCPLLVECP